MARLMRGDLIERVRQVIDGEERTMLIYDDAQTMTPEQIVNAALAYMPRAIHLPLTMPSDDEE